MHHTPRQLSGLIDLLVEAVLREMETEANDNGDESQHEQRHRSEVNGNPPAPNFDS
jgi:hypothetical protein